MCFGGGGQPQEDPGLKKNEEIEKMLRLEKKKADKEVKLLLLGAGESGKSTVLKQMRLIHAGGFSPEERKQWRIVIFNNLTQAFSIISRAMEEQGVPYENQGNIKYAGLVRSDTEITASQPFPPEFLVAFKALWSDKGVQLAIEKGNEYALHDNLTYYFHDVDRLFSPTYIPSDQDILRARLRTTGINETIFDLGNLTYRMFDVGGQRSERKKWIHVFDNVQVVLFLVAISGYDQVLVEDRDGNQMREAMMLFETIANSRWFEKSAMILFLNKIDLFREKVESGQSPISNYFEEYTGPAKDVKAGEMFFANKFKNLVQQRNSERPKEIYVHFTNATDTDLLKKTMSSVQDMIVQNNLNTLIL